MTKIFRTSLSSCFSLSSCGYLQNYSMTNKANLTYVGVSVKFFLWSFLLIFATLPAFAKSPTLADAKNDMLQQMQADGLLTEAAAKEAKKKYIQEQDAKLFIQKASAVESTEEESSWTEYISLINFIKILAVILLLIAFSGILKKLILTSWALIRLVPVWLYQSIFLAASIYASLFPASIWASQFFYIALLGIFGNLILVGWILSWWDKLRYRLVQLLSIGLPLISIISFLLLIYFSCFAIVYESSFLGFFAAVSLSGVFTFSLFYMPGILFLDFKENALPAMIFGHLLALALYITFLLLGIAADYLVYFNAGIQYYCTLAMGVALLVGSSPFYKSAPLFYFLLFVLICVAATLLYFFAGLTGMAIIIYGLFSLVFLEWIGYLGFRMGVITGLLLIGGFLFAIALMLERYASVILSHFRI